MINCSDIICKNCFKAHFTIVIKEKSIQYFTCPICGLPEISHGDLSTELQIYFKSLSVLVSSIMYILLVEFHIPYR